MVKAPLQYGIIVSTVGRFQRSAAAPGRRPRHKNRVRDRCHCLEACARHSSPTNALYLLFYRQISCLNGYWILMTPCANVPRRNVPRPPYGRRLGKKQDFFLRYSMPLSIAMALNARRLLLSDHCLRRVTESSVDGALYLEDGGYYTTVRRHLQGSMLYVWEG